MNKRALRTTAIATIVAFLIPLGVGDLLVYYFTGHHLKPLIIAGVCVIAVVMVIWGYVRGRKHGDS